MWATCYPNHCFCESLHSGTFLQPANTFSSLIFVVAGIFLAYRYRNSWSYIYSALLAFIGLGSFYYHARFTFVGQTIDTLGMYLLVTLALLAILEKNKKYFLGYFLLMNTILLMSLIYLPTWRQQIFGALVLILVAALWKKAFFNKYLWISLLVLFTAFIIWICDITRIWCSPDRILQGHSIWHILCAVSAVLLFQSIQPRLNK